MPLSFGATKNARPGRRSGGVLRHLAGARFSELRRKRAGHLFSKSRYVAAQLLAYVEGGL
jgi:threonine aldolase